MFLNESFDKKMVNCEALVLARVTCGSNPTAQLNGFANLDTFLSLSFPSFSCLTIGTEMPVSQDSCKN